MSKTDTNSMRQISLRRIIWVFYVKITTFWIPTALLSLFITKERQQAWKEKLTLFCTFLLICGLFSFWLEYITYLFCDPPPTFYFKEVYSNDSFSSSINGQVVDWCKLGNTSTMTQQVNLYPHRDLSAMFPTFMLLKRQDDQTTYSNNIINTCINSFNRSTQADNWLNYKLTNDPGYLYQDGQLISCPLPDQRNETGASCFYTVEDMQEYQKYHKKGALEFSAKAIASNYSTLPYDYTKERALVILDNKVLDVTDYLTASTNIVQVAKDTYSRSFALDRMFLPLDLTILLFINMGKDISTAFHQNIADNDIYKECLLELFYYGVLDTDDDDEGCARINLALWVTLGWFFLYFFIRMNLANLSGLKSIQHCLYHSSDKTIQPGNLRLSQPFLLFFIPCFRESSELVRTTFDSLARCSYPDNRKFLFFVCDGLAKNGTDDKETYLCILESLGYSSSKEPELRTYISLGQGSRRINYAKVFAGFYESGSNRVPFIMVVKVGAPSESLSETRVPGNRGKRDSMMIVLGFLERCMNLAQNRITPLEFEIFNQCYNVLGIDPREIKYMLATDSDTQVQEDAVFKMVSRMEKDPKISAISGHLKPANPEENMITMLQIFPLYMAFFSGLSYEACLGKVTTLNGGFVMYRLWSSKCDNYGERSLTKWPKVSDEIVDISFKTATTEFDDDSSDDNTTTASNISVSSRQKPVPRRRLQKPNKQQQSAPLSLAPNPRVELCCISPTVLRGFAATRPDTMHMENVLLLGEEQYFSLVLVRSMPHHYLAFEPGAIGYSMLPTHFFALQALMIRNIRVTFHNQLEFQAMSRHLGVMYWLVSFTKLLDMIFTVPLTCYLYSIFIRYFIYKSLAFAIIAGSFTCLMLLHVFYFMIRRQFKYIIWFCLFCFVSVPLFNVYFPLLAIWCSDYANVWHDIYPMNRRCFGRLHGIVENKPCEEKLEEVARMRLSEFEVLEAEKAALREKEQAEMLDAKFSGFTGYVNSTAVMGHANKPSWSSLVSMPAQAKVRAGHSRFASEEDARILSNSPRNPFMSMLDDPFDDTNNSRRSSALLQHKPSPSMGSPVIQHYRSHSNTSSTPLSNEYYDDNDSIVSLNPSLVTSVISLEQDTYHEDDQQVRGGRLAGRRTPYYEEMSEGRSAPVHSKFTLKYS